MSQKRLQLKMLSGRCRRPLLYAESNEKKHPVVKVGRDQILLVPMSFKVGGTRPTGPIGWLRLWNYSTQMTSRASSPLSHDKNESSMTHLNGPLVSSSESEVVSTSGPVA